MNNGSFSGSLDSVWVEAYGWAYDCGMTPLSDNHLYTLLQERYQGGVLGYLMDVQPLW